MIELTKQQWQAVLDGGSVELTPAEIGRKVLILRADAYEGLQELLEEERTRKSLATVAGRAAVKRAEEEP